MSRVDLEILADIVRFREETRGMTAAGPEIRDMIEQRKRPFISVQAQDFAVLYRTEDGRSDRPVQVYGIVHARSTDEATAMCRVEIAALTGDRAVPTWAWPISDAAGLASDGITAEALGNARHVASLLNPPAGT